MNNFSLVLFSLSMLSAVALAQNSSDNEQPEDLVQTQDASASAQNSAPTTGKNDPNYTPTEEISDDLSVSFPVDI